MEDRLTMKCMLKAMGLRESMIEAILEEQFGEVSNAELHEDDLELFTLGIGANGVGVEVKEDIALLIDVEEVIGEAGQKALVDIANKIADALKNKFERMGVGFNDK